MPTSDPYHAKAREMYARAVSIPTVLGRGRVNELAEYLQAELRAGGFSDVTIHRHEARNSTEVTSTLVLRWPAERPSRRKAILLMAHLDVVDAIPSDWSRDPFQLIEEDGYFYGRGTLDNKQGVVSLTMALLRLSAEGFRPDRDVYMLLTGDEEVLGRGAELAANEWLDISDFDFALNSDAGGGGWMADGTPLGFSIQTSEKVYQDFTLTATNAGGHSSRPRPDNAIYALAAVLGRLANHRFESRLNETTRAMFSDRLRTADPPLAEAIRRFLTDPTDDEAADAIEASPTEIGFTRTTCVATRLEGGHANNALPQLARATVNCRLCPGEDPAELLATLQGIAAPDGVVVESVDQARPADASPLRDDVVAAFTAEIHARHPDVSIVPNMSTGGTDGIFFRSRGLPVYGVGGDWIVVPEDERAHGRDERLPVRAFYQSLDHWVGMIRRLAGAPQS